MKVTTEFLKSQIIDKISQDTKLDDYKKELLGFLLDIDSNFFHFSFGLGDETSVNWDYIYIEMKSYFTPALLNSDWNFSFGEACMDEELFIVCISFSQTEIINDFIFHGTYEKDNRKKFNVLEIYLTRIEMKMALEQGLIKDSGTHKWLQDSLSR